ncbi:MAG: cupredoxin family protein [Rubrivivax sp.]|nr:cupredoxin family protein [Rubrivivax sp.]
MQSSKRQVLRQVLLAAPAVALALTGFARAHGNEGHAKKAGPVPKEQKDWGIAGDPKAARRTIEVSMADSMRFTPDRIDVRLGETLRFRIRNTGKLMHEFVIGTRLENLKHAELMVKFPNMEHDEPYMAHVPPGKTGEIVWTFNRAGTFEFACLIAGHYQAGMVGTIQVTGS